MPDDIVRIGDSVHALSSVGARVGGRLIDNFLFVALSIVLVGVFARIRTEPNTWVGPTVIAAYVVYEVALLRSHGATIGKTALGLRVLRLDGQSPDLQTALRRTLAYQLGPIALLAYTGRWSFALAVGWPVMLLATIAADGRRRGLHDRFGGTLVVKRAPPAIDA